MSLDCCMNLVTVVARHKSQKAPMRLVHLCAIAMDRSFVDASLESWFHVD
jgi:hypothetical protein